MNAKTYTNRPARDIQQEITDRIVAQLEAGTPPWLKPWKDGRSANTMLPYNAAAKTSYHGVNILTLWAESDARGYSSNGWMTFNQAKEKGGSVRKGEHGAPVVYWNFREYENDEGDKKKIPFVKYSTVFNLEQLDGIEAPDITNDRDVSDSIEHAYKFVKNTGADIRHGGNSACFIPSRDLIQMPNFEQFRDAENYYATLLHELTHWTHGTGRIDRDFGRKRWGDAGYAMEELVAEMGAAFLCAELGITAELQHASYIASWIKVLKEDKRAIFTAASHASKAAEFLAGRKNQESEDSQELSKAA